MSYPKRKKGKFKYKVVRVGMKLPYKYTKTKKSAEKFVEEMKRKGRYYGLKTKKPLRIKKIISKRIYW